MNAHLQPIVNAPQARNHTHKKFAVNSLIAVLETNCTQFCLVVSTNAKVLKSPVLCENIH